MPPLPLTRVVLYKHGVGHFERQGAVEGDAALSLTFKQAEVSDVLKSLTVLDLDGGHIASVSYDSTKPLEQLLAEVALSIPDEGSLVALLPQIKGARVAVSPPGGERVEGAILGIDSSERHSADGVVRLVLLSLLTESGEVRSFDLHGLDKLELLDAALRRDLDYYLRTQLSAKKKDSRTFTFFAQGSGKRTVRVSYTTEAPVWKATYRIILGEEGKPPLIQGWAVVDNTQDEDWENVSLSLIAGLPVSFVHDLYTPRYIRRPVVEVRETTGVLPPTVQDGMELAAMDAEYELSLKEEAAAGGGGRGRGRAVAAVKSVRSLDSLALAAAPAARALAAPSSMPAQVRERKLGDLFEYEIEHPVTIRRNQSALVPIVLRPFEGRPVLLHNRDTRPENPMRSVELKNTTGLTLEGGPLTVLEGGSYVGEAMLDTLKPDQQRLVPYAVELAVRVLDNVKSHREKVHRVVIRNGRLTTYRARVERRTYTFDSKADAEHTLYLDHARGGEGWQLVDTPEPVEVTEGYWRFRFALPARKVTAFTVKQRLVEEQVQSLSDLDASFLGTWLEQKYVDAATERVLREVVEALNHLAEIEARLQRLNEEHERIHKEQGRLRENLNALGDRSSEKGLRERYVRSLGEQEDRLEEIAAESKERQAEHDRTRARVAAALAGLEYEAEVV